MTTKYLTGTYTSGYTMSSAYQALSIISTGHVQGGGVYTPASSPSFLEIDNDGLIGNHNTNIPGGYGVGLETGARFVNGGPSDTGAYVYGSQIGVFAAAGVHAIIVNYANVRSSGVGIDLLTGGVVTNGSTGDSAAFIAGGGDGVLLHAAGTVTNYGTISGVAQIGVYLGQGGSLANEATGRVRGGEAGVAGAAGTVVNDGRIVGHRYQGIDIADGVVVNGSVSDLAAVIAGYGGGVKISTGTVTNFATIAADISGYGAGVYTRGANVTNGAPADLTALIVGVTGEILQSATACANFGTIQGIGGDGAQVNFGSHLVNGSPADRAARIVGVRGAYVANGGDLTNFGTVRGDHGTAVAMSPSGTLTVEAGCAFEGAIQGGGGSLVLGSGTGALTLLAKDDAAVSGSMAATTFHNFGVVEVGPGGNFTLPAVQSVAAGQRLIDDGTMTIGQTLASQGTVTVAGSLSGGTLDIASGSLTLSPGASLSLAQVAVSVGAVRVATSLAYSGKWLQSGGSLLLGKGAALTLKGASDAFAGALEGLGVVALTGTLTLGATTIASGAILETTNSLANLIIGQSASTTLANSGRIVGAGDLGGGKLTLVNKAGAAIVASSTIAMTIDVGGGAIQNAGAIDCTAAGGLTIKSAVANAGFLAVTAGTLLAQGAITGAGSVKIGGGVAEFTGTFGENVAFTGPNGTLELAHSQSYTGQVSGFSKTGGTAFDLLDIAYTGGTTKASYAGSATSGILTVTDGAHTARITLEGNYLSSVFNTASDGHGGTSVLDPQKQHVPPFIEAVATFGARGAGELDHASPLWRPSPLLGAPRAAFA